MTEQKHKKAANQEEAWKIQDMREGLPARGYNGKGLMFLWKRPAYVGKSF